MMDAEDQPAGLDLAGVRRGSRLSHRFAWLIFGFGVVGYAFLALWMLALYVLDRDQALFAPTVTLPLDTAMALLALCATVLIALVASLWASNQVSDAALSQGRRRALMVVIYATGAGSIIVGTAGALHRPDEGWNFIIVVALFGLGLVLAYITADVGVFLVEDRSLDAALQRRDAEDRIARLRTARRNWLWLTRQAGWARARHPIRNRLGQSAVPVALMAVALIAGLAALGGRPAVTGYLGWSFFDVMVGLLVGQLAVHFLAVTFVARRWEAFWWHCGYVVLYVLVSAVAQQQLWASMHARFPKGGLLEAGIVLGCWVIPPLLCLLGLTVVPRRWRRWRPTTQIRWSVIEAIGREIDRVAVTLCPAGPEKRPARTAQLVRAIRRANGTEEVGAGGG